MGTLFTFLAVSYQIFFSYLALVAVIAAVDWPMKLVELLPRELTNEEHFIASGVILFSVSVLAIFLGNYYFRITLDARPPSTREKNVFENIQKHLGRMYKQRFNDRLLTGPMVCCRYKITNRFCLWKKQHFSESRAPKNDKAGASYEKRV